MLEAVVELVCERIPAALRARSRGREVMTLVPMRPGPVGLIALNEELERRLNPGEQPVVLARSGLRVGSRIVQTKNDYTPDREVMNGEVAFIIEWDEEEGEARLSLDDGEREIVVPARRTRDVQPRLGADRAPRAGLAVSGRRRAVVDGVLPSCSPARSSTRRSRARSALRPRRRAQGRRDGSRRGEQRRRHSALAERILDAS